MIFTKRGSSSIHTIFHHLKEGGVSHTGSDIIRKFVTLANIRTRSHWASPCRNHPYTCATSLLFIGKPRSPRHQQGRQAALPPLALASMSEPCHGQPPSGTRLAMTLAPITPASAAAPVARTFGCRFIVAKSLAKVVAPYLPTLSVRWAHCAPA